jgi:hypothetical protein
MPFWLYSKKILPSGLFHDSLRDTFPPWSMSRAHSTALLHFKTVPSLN